MRTITVAVGQGLEAGVGVWGWILHYLPPGGAECAGEGRKGPALAELTAIGEIININHFKM